MAVTAHYIDNNWKPQSRMIRFVFVPPPYTGEVLCETLAECSTDWNIGNKLSTITVNNCSTNNEMMSLLSNKLPQETVLVDVSTIHMRCGGHILNLVMKVGLEVIGVAIQSIRNVIDYWKGTAERWEKLKETARELGIAIVKKLYVDCGLCLDSTYLMLKTALEYKDVFLRLEHHEPELCVPSELDWNLTREICDPRYKGDVLECYFPKIYPENSEREVEKILMLCRKLVASESNPEVFETTFHRYVSQRKRKPARSELDIYLEENIIPLTPDVDVLLWWKLNEARYPIMHKLARDILAIPVSAIPLESAFNTNGRVVSPHRSRLLPDTIEALTCTKNWLRAKSKNYSERNHTHDADANLGDWDDDDEMEIED